MLPDITALSTTYTQDLVSQSALGEPKLRQQGQMKQSGYERPCIGMPTESALVDIIKLSGAHSTVAHKVRWLGASTARTIGPRQPDFLGSKIAIWCSLSCSGCWYHYGYRSQ